MKTTVSEYDFIEAFENIRPDNFSYEALQLLFDWFEQLEEAEGSEIELDVIGVCCDFNEETRAEILDNYQPEELDEFSTDNEFLEWLEYHTILVGETTENRFVYMAF